MGKRKGSDYAAAPTTAVVSASIDDRTTSAATSPGSGRDGDGTTTSSDAASSARPSSSWDSTKLLIRDLIGECEASDDAGRALRCLDLNAGLEDRRRSVLSTSESIKSDVRARIDAADEAVRSASSDLRARSDHVSSLASEADELRRRNEDLLIRRRDAEARIDRYRAEAGRALEGVDEVEASRMEEVPKIQMQIALYAKVVGIRWNYDDCVDGLLSGELAVPSKGAFRAFKIDSKEYDDFEVANELWDMMDGREPTLCA